MEQHPIEGLMNTAMESIKDMIDVNTIVGDAVLAPDGTTIIPISKVAFGFAAGGGDYNNANTVANGMETENSEQESGGSIHKFPFAGGSGAGVSINPVAFMVVGHNQIKLMPVNANSSLEKIIDLLPQLFEKANDTVKRKINIRKEFKNGEDTTS